MGSRGGGPEAGMAGTMNAKQGNRQWMVWPFWVAGIGLLVVEMSAGMDYVQASLKQQMVELLGWFPAMGLLTLKFAEQAFWNYGSLESALRTMPLVALPFVLLGVGVALGRRTVR
jgi:hypothetical protein